MKAIEFQGKLINLEKVNSVSEVKTIQTGPLQCDWDYGFTVHMEGTDLDFVIPTPTDSNWNHKLSRKDRINVANGARTIIVNMITGGQDH